MSGVPGEVVFGDGDIEINQGAVRIEMEVVNTGDRPVQVGSHVHLPQANAALEFTSEMTVARTRRLRARSMAASLKKGLDVSSCSARAPVVRHLRSDVLPVALAETQKVAVEGRQMARSALPSPS